MTVLAYTRLAQRVLVAPPRLGATRLVCVDGHAGSGKSTFARRLGTALQELAAASAPVPVVHMDDVFAGWHGLCTASERLADQVLDPLRNGEPAGYEVWDWAADRYGARRELPVSDVLVVEGCASADRVVDGVATLRVWVQVPQGLRRQRGLARDGDEMAPYWDDWMGQEARHFAQQRTASRCDIVVDGNPSASHDPEREFVTATRDATARERVQPAAERASHARSACTCTRA